MLILFITIAKNIVISQNMVNTLSKISRLQFIDIFYKKQNGKSPFRDFPKTFRILPIVITQKPPLKGF